MFTLDWLLNISDLSSEMLLIIWTKSFYSLQENRVTYQK